VALPALPLRKGPRCISEGNPNLTILPGFGSGFFSHRSSRVLVDKNWRLRSWKMGNVTKKRWKDPPYFMGKSTITMEKSTLFYWLVVVYPYPSEKSWSEFVSWDEMTVSI